MVPAHQDSPGQRAVKRLFVLWFNLFKVNNGFALVLCSESFQQCYLCLQSQFPEVNDAELKEMEAQIGSMTQKLKDSTDTQKRLDSG